MLEERKYAIINTSEVENIDWNDVCHASARELRINNDGTKCVVSYRGRQPLCLDGKQEYTASEIAPIVQSDTNEWYIPQSGADQEAWYNRAKDVLTRYNPFKDWF